MTTFTIVLLAHAVLNVAVGAFAAYFSHQQIAHSPPVQD